MRIQPQSSRIQADLVVAVVYLLAGVLSGQGGLCLLSLLFHAAELLVGLLQSHVQLYGQPGPTGTRR